MNAVDEVIENMIRAVARQQQIRGPQRHLHLKKSTALIDELGFTSCSLIVLFADLEEVFGVDPLNDEGVLLTDIRTVGDLCDVYGDCLARAE